MNLGFELDLTTVKMNQTVNSLSQKNSKGHLVKSYKSATLGWECHPSRHLFAV